MFGAVTTAFVQGCLDRLKGGDAAARSELLRGSADRLLDHTRRMLRQFAAVQRWEQTDDVCQNAMIRLCRALDAVVPPTPLDFFKLAATQIRRELIDLARHYRGPRGVGANHQSMTSLGAVGDAAGDPVRFQQWVAFHEAAGGLPDDLRAVFDLVWYQGLTQEDAAGVLGVSVRTVKSRWRDARLALHDRLGGELPSD